MLILDIMVNIFDLYNCFGEQVFNVYLVLYSRFLNIVRFVYFILQLSYIIHSKQLFVD